MPLVVIAGKEYGSGSSRDWAAKGTLLLGVRAVIAGATSASTAPTWSAWACCRCSSLTGESAESLGLDGPRDVHDPRHRATLEPRATLTVRGDARRRQRRATFEALARVDTPVEREYLRHGGILQMVLRRMMAG